MLNPLENISKVQKNPFTNPNWLCHITYLALVFLVYKMGWEEGQEVTLKDDLEVLF